MNNKQITECHICNMPIKSLIQHAIEGSCELTEERLINIGYCTKEDVLDFKKSINKGIGRGIGVPTDSNTK